MPLIKERYKSDATKRIIFGQSIGGQFVLYTALTEPNPFWGHIASNSALHRNLSFFLSLHGESTVSTSQSRLFVAEGTRNDLKYRQPSQEWIHHWSVIKNRPWDFQSVDLEAHSPMSTPPAAFRRGMAWLFSDE